MRYPWYVGLLILAGCVSALPDEPTTQQVSATTFAEPRKPLPTRVQYAPASQEASFRVVQVRDKLIGDNPQIGLKPFVIAIGSADPEVFHVGLNYIYITEGLIRQCNTDGQLAGVLANELGRMVSEREATVAAEVRQPDRPLPIRLPIGGAGSSRDTNPLGDVELAKYEKAYPKHAPKLTPPNPQHVARSILEKAGFQRTELDAAQPILQNAERYRVMENQFKGTTKQGDWKAP